MSQIRKYAQIDDVIVGMAGSGRAGLKRIHPQIIYWMQVDEILSFDQYWDDPRFSRKKPQISGPKFRVVGDNTYRHDARTDDWVFEISMHHILGAPQPNGGHVASDTRVDRVLLAKRFTYWGKDGPAISDHLMQVFPRGRGWKCNHPDPAPIAELQEFIGLENPLGIVGEPADWGNQRYYSKS